MLRVCSTAARIHASFKVLGLWTRSSTERPFATVIDEPDRRALRIRRDGRVELGLVNLPIRVGLDEIDACRVKGKRELAGQPSSFY